MSLIKTYTRFMAAATAASFILAPVAQADRDRGHDRDRGGWERGDDDHRGWRGHDRDDDHRGRRGDWDDDDRHYYRDYDRDDRHYYRDHRRDRVVVYKPYYPRSSVTVTYGHSYGPY